MQDGYKDYGFHSSGPSHMHRHFMPLIKLWSRKTLARLMTEAGFTNIQFRGAGRLPWLWMTMVMSGDKPACIL
jgi:hypothetical protein